MAQRKDYNQILQEMLQKAKEKGIEVRLERLEAGSIRPRDGMCLLKGERKLFLEKRRPLKELILYLKEYIEDQEGPFLRP